MTHHNYLTKMANAIIDDDTGKELDYHQLSKNLKYKHMETIIRQKLGRIFQGEEGHMDGTSTMSFITKYQVTSDRIKYVTYGRKVVDYRPQK